MKHFFLSSDTSSDVTYQSCTHLSNQERKTGNTFPYNQRGKSFKINDKEEGVEEGHRKRIVRQGMTGSQLTLMMVSEEENDDDDDEDDDEDNDDEDAAAREGRKEKRRTRSHNSAKLTKRVDRFGISVAALFHQKVRSCRH